MVLPEGILVELRSSLNSWALTLGRGVVSMLWPSA